MVNVDEAVIAKIKLKDEEKVRRHGDLTFEILVDCDKAMALGKGKET